MAGGKDIPVFVSIAEKLQQKISQHGYAPGALLPREVELAEMYGVSRSTLRNAMAILEKDGWIIRKKRFGTIVAPDALRRKYRKIDIGFFSRCSLTDHNEYLYLFQNNLHMGHVLRRAVKRGYFVRFFAWGIGNGDNRQYDLDEILLHKQVDAFIVSSPAYLTDVMDKLRTLHLPHIALETHVDKPGVNSFVFDEMHAMRVLMEKLRENGHAKVGLLGGVLKRPELRSCTRRTLDAFLQVSAEMGMTVKDEWICCTGADEWRNAPPPIHEFCHELLSCRELPTAVITKSPHSAEIFIAAAARMGLRVPEDISVLYASNLSSSDDAVKLDITGINYDMDYFADAVLDELLLCLRKAAYKPKCHTVCGELNPGTTLKKLN